MQAAASAGMAKARDRVRSGKMVGVSKLLIFNRHPLATLNVDRSSFIQVRLVDIAGSPPWVDSNVRLTSSQRQEIVKLSVKGSDEEYLACVFARVETGVTDKEVESVIHDHLDPAFSDVFHDGPKLSVHDAYNHLVRTFPEGLYCGFSYQDFSRGEILELEVVSGRRGEVNQDPLGGHNDHEEAVEGPPETLRARSTEHICKGLDVTPPTSPLSAGHSSPPSHGNLPKLSRSKTLFRGATLTDSEVRSVLASSKEGTAMPMELDGAGAKDPDDSVAIVAVVHPQLPRSVPESELASQVNTTCMTANTSKGMKTSITALLSSDQQAEAEDSDDSDILLSLL